MPTHTIPYTIIDAFTSVPFEGNPAAIVLLKQPQTTSFDDTLLQKIAREFNLSETAFLIPRQGDTTSFGLRWFTPARELGVCGHATLASAYALFNGVIGLVEPGTEVLTFHTMSGELKARRVLVQNVEGRDTGMIELEFPVARAEVTDESVRERVEGIVQRAFGDSTVRVVRAGLGAGAEYKGIAIVEVGETFDLENAKIVDQSALMELDAGSWYGVTVTSTRRSTRNPKARFMSRVFAPHVGVPEDPVCGSAHCVLAAYWSERLAIAKGEVIHARQVSPRGGDVDVGFDGDRAVMKLRGEAVIVQKGEMYF